MKQGYIAAFAVVATILAGYYLIGRLQDKKTTDANSIKEIYNQWKVQYNLHIGASEDDLRLKIFTQNYEFINDHNKIPGTKYQLGLNPYAHLTRTEFSAIHLGYSKVKADTSFNMTGKECSNNLTFTVPDAIDWVTSGKVSRVKNQAQCGSCWAFSAVGAIESLLAITTGTVTELSEQQVVDCSTSYGNEGCNGGEMNLAFKYVAENGIAIEADYPYKGVDSQCAFPTKGAVFHISGYRNVTVNSSDALKSAVAKNPVSVAIEADTSAFQLYKSGVLTGDACGTELDHGVLAVGYGNQNGTDFWKVKNSWGPNWGDQGFILIERRDGAGTCGINMDAAYPTHYC